MIHTRRPKEFWEQALRELIKGELRKRGWTHADFAGKLRKAGGIETQTTITNKLSRGTFRASFLAMALAVLGMETLEIGRVAGLGYKLEKGRKKKARGRSIKLIKKSKPVVIRSYDEEGREIGQREISDAIKSRLERGVMNSKK